MLSLLAAISCSAEVKERDFYDILGLPHNCTIKEIEKSYKILSRKYHPDKNKNKDKPEIVEKYNDITYSYSALRDPLKRRVFDLFGEQGVKIYEASRPDLDKGMDYGNDNDLAIQIRRIGPTIRYQFPVDLIDFYNGKKFEINVTRRAICRCPEAGFLCEKCHGRPTIREDVTLPLYLEKGSDDGTVYLFKNQGDTSEENAPGNIEIQVICKKHPLYTRNGSDIHMNINLTLKQALLGFQIEATHFDGKPLTIKSDKAIDCNTPIVIRNRGLPKYMYPDEYGDLVVHPRILWPKSLTQEQQKQLSNVLKQDN